MPTSHPSIASDHDQRDGNVDQHEDEELQTSLQGTGRGRNAASSPLSTRTNVARQLPHLHTRGRPMESSPADESSSLLARSDGPPSGYRTLPASAPGTPRSGGLKRSLSYAGSLRGARVRNHNRTGSFGFKLARALDPETNEGGRDDAQSIKAHMYRHDRVWYDQFTSTDWVHDSIADAYRIKELRSRKGWRGRLVAFLDGGQGWLLVAIIGVMTAAFAYVINTTEKVIFDWKMGYCTTGWWLSKNRCCTTGECEDWRAWSDFLHGDGLDRIWAQYAVFIGWVVLLACLSCLVTLQTRTAVSSIMSLSTLDENLGADHHGTKSDNEGRRQSGSPVRQLAEAASRPPLVFYPAAGSGVAEVKVILSGFVLHGYLGVRTLTCKTIGLILSVASGLSLGKEGPYVHIATCVGNIASRFFPKYRDNDGKRREVLSASAAAGVAVAFGAPIGGVLFSLEEVSYYFPPKTLFRTFFCCIAAALSLKFLDPYGTGKIVLFEVRYIIDWKFFELIAFVLLGVLGGLLGAIFIKASRFWAKTFRRIPAIRKSPMLEVFIVALVTAVVSFWNRYTRLPVAELLFELASPCDAFSETGTGLCPTEERIPQVILDLVLAFVIKAALTTVTFGIKVPAGIYVPSMVVGGLLGRIVGHSVQLLAVKYQGSGFFTNCPVGGSPESCVIPGVYALVAAGATMCGVTRLSVTLAVILFELTGSLEHVLPFSLGILIAKWTADAVEPLSIYDLLTDMNEYPYLNSKIRPVFTTDLEDITPTITENHYIDISVSPLVPAKELRSKLNHLHLAGELDSGLPILRDTVLVGLIPAPDLEYALDRLEGEESALCLMSTQDRWQGPGRGVVLLPNESAVASADVDDEESHLLVTSPEGADRTDFTPFIDPAPVSLDICSSMDLVFECFVKLGLRYICVLKEGRFAGLVHKKVFVRYVKELEKQGNKR